MKNKYVKNMNMNFEQESIQYKQKIGVHIIILDALVAERNGQMKREEVLAALKAGEFDGISHTYQPYSGYGKNGHQIEMCVSFGTIEVTKITTGKSFNGKENERFEDRTTEVLSDYKAVDFIEARPYYFKQRRPDLF